MKKEYKETICFIHTDGNQYTFKTEPNPLTSSQMWWFEPLHSMYAGTVREAKAIAKNIKRNVKIIEEVPNETCKV